MYRPSWLTVAFSSFHNSLLPYTRCNRKSHPRKSSMISIIPLTTELDCRLTYSLLCLHTINQSKSPLLLPTIPYRLQLPPGSSPSDLPLDLALDLVCMNTWHMLTHVVWVPPSQINVNLTRASYYPSHRLNPSTKSTHASHCTPPPSQAREPKHPA